MKQHTIQGGNDITLHVDETGTEAGDPILFIHGYTQSRLSWDRQMDSDLAENFRLVAMDDRGHGLSDKPKDAYGNSDLWADDVQGVISELSLDQPVLCGWSYGGLIIADYLAKYGTEHIAGVNLVGAISKLGTEDAMAVIGEDFTSLVPGFEATDAEESVRTLETFVRRCSYDDPSPQEFYYILGFNTTVPPYIRAGLHSREVTHDDTLADLGVPVLVTHGEEDTVVLPAAGEEHAEMTPDTRTSSYPAAGHSPFWEAPERFNQELRELATEV
jgi:pimeloyl-ACP methyl ester carboxylesterase